MILHKIDRIDSANITVLSIAFYQLYGNYWLQLSLIRLVNSYHTVFRLITFPYNFTHYLVLIFIPQFGNNKREMNDLKIVRFLVFSNKFSAQLIFDCSPHFSESFYYVSSHRVSFLLNTEV